MIGALVRRLICTFYGISLLGWAICAHLAAGEVPAPDNFPLRLLTEDYAPYNYMEQGQLVGVSVELVQEICHRLNLPSRIEVLPWARAYEIAQQDAHAVLFTTTLTQERKALFQWVGPLIDTKWAFFALKGSGITITSLEEAKSAGKIGTQKDDAGELLLKRLGFTNVETAPYQINNAQKLARGHINLWLVGDIEIPFLARQAGIDPASLEMVFSFPMPGETAGYIAFNRQAPPELVAAWRRTLDDLKRDGTYERIVAKYCPGIDSAPRKPGP